MNGAIPTSVWRCRIGGWSALLATGMAACNVGPMPACVQLSGGDDLVFGAPVETLPAGEGLHEGPRVRSLQPFEMAVHLVTNAEFCEFLNTGSAAVGDAARLVAVRSFPQYEPCAIVCHEGRWQCTPEARDWACEQATWLGAFSFCRWLTTTRSDGHVYSLPSEWEWEHAVRGAECRTWPWGDAAPGPERGRRWQRIPWHEARLRRGVTVGSHPAGATPEGIHDLMGTGSLEWCRDACSVEPEATTSEDFGADPDLSVLRAARGRSVQQRTRLTLLQALFSETNREAMSWSRFACEPIRAAERQPFVFRWIRRGRD